MVDGCIFQMLGQISIYIIFAEVSGWKLAFGETICLSKRQEGQAA
jgi:hypothetical protein